MLAWPSHSCTLAISALCARALVAAVARWACTQNPWTSALMPTSAPYLFTIPWYTESGCRMFCDSSFRRVTAVKRSFKGRLFMDCQLTFKKAFGLEAITPETACWLSELQYGTFQVKSGDMLFHVSVGSMGETEQEKLAIMPFLHSDE